MVQNHKTVRKVDELHHTVMEKIHLTFRNEL